MLQSWLMFLVLTYSKETVASQEIQKIRPFHGQTHIKSTKAARQRLLIWEILSYYQILVLNSSNVLCHSSTLRFPFSSYRRPRSNRATTKITTKNKFPGNFCRTFVINSATKSPFVLETGNFSIQGDISPPSKPKLSVLPTPDKATTATRIKKSTTLPSKLRHDLQMIVPDGTDGTDAG